MALAVENTIPEMEKPKVTLRRGAVGGANPTNSAKNSGSLLRGGCNPTAIAMLFLYKVMDLYSKITGINAKEQISQIDGQGKAARGEAEAIKESAIKSGTAMIAGAGVAMLGSLVGGVVGNYKGEIMANNEELGPAEEEMSHLNKVQSLADADPDAVEGEVGDVEGRKNELLRGEYKSPSGADDATTKEALEELKGDDEEQYEDFRQRLDDREDTLEKKRNTVAMKNQESRQKWSNFGTMISGPAQSVNSLSQAIGSMQKGHLDAEASLDRTTSSMAQQTASSQEQAKSKSADAQNAVVNTLNAIRQASSNV